MDVDDQELARFMEATGAGPDQAQFFLEACGGNYERALSMFYGELQPARLGSRPAEVAGKVAWQGTPRRAAAPERSGKPAGFGLPGQVISDCAAYRLTQLITPPACLHRANQRRAPAPSARRAPAPACPRRRRRRSRRPARLQPRRPRAAAAPAAAERCSGCSVHYRWRQPAPGGAQP
jgi:hypothetical protein